MKTSKKGFTLIELMIAISIMGILAIVLIPKFSASKDVTKEKQIEVNMLRVQEVMESIIRKYSVNDSTTTASSLNAYNLEVVNIVATSIKNPYSESTTATTIGAFSNGNSFVINTSTPTWITNDFLEKYGSDGTSFNTVGVNINDLPKAGLITAETFIENGRLKVVMYCYNGKGKLYLAKKNFRVISQY